MAKAQSKPAAAPVPPAERLQEIMHPDVRAQWEEYFAQVAAQRPSEEKLNEIREAARLGKIQAEIDRRANAFPLLETETLVRATIWGWRMHNSRVVTDPGPAGDGSRKVTIEKFFGRGAGETATVRYDRLHIVPTGTQQTVAG